MRKSKFNFFAAIGMVVALGMVAFTAPKENIQLEEIYWFQVNDDEIGNFMDSNPQEPCLGSETLCAVGLSESEVDLGTGANPPTPLISNPEDASRKSYGHQIR